jgi:hypothetical protein
MLRTSMTWFGVLLVLVGCVLLLRGMGVLELEWGIVLWTAVGVGGAVWVIRGFRRSEPGRVFWGTMLFLGALFMMLRSVPYVQISSYYAVPAGVLALGLAFLSAFICRPRNLPLLVSAAVFCSLAGGIWMVEFGYLYRWDVVSAVQSYWPVALILFGASLLVPRRAS